MAEQSLRSWADCINRRISAAHDSIVIVAANLGVSVRARLALEYSFIEFQPQHLLLVCRAASFAFCNRYPDISTSACRARRQTSLTSLRHLGQTKRRA